ncbi:hypothetical protein Ddc_02347 [Ditylenchus destructor]|nr:hypothetical protein Ddc_02347 [Ditylenchus destructor]
MRCSQPIFVYIKELRAHVSFCTGTVQDLLSHCERLERLEFFEVENISSSSPKELRDIILAELRKRKVTIFLRNGDNFLPLHICGHKLGQELSRRCGFYSRIIVLNRRAVETSLCVPEVCT